MANLFGEDSFTIGVRVWRSVNAAWSPESS
jgi:hypothetical protein